MRVELHGLSFVFDATDAGLQANVRKVLRSYGLPVVPESISDPDGLVVLEIGERLPLPPSDARSVGVDNNGVAIHEQGGVFHLQTHGTAFVVDTVRMRARGTFLAADLPRLGAPLMWLTMWTLNLLLRSCGFFPLHAAALAAPGGGGLLAAAPSGSGKTTLACNLLRSGWHFLSDDTVLLHLVDGTVEARTFRVNFSLREDSHALFPELVPHWGAVRPVHERKRWVSMREVYPEQAREACLPCALVFPEIAREEQSRIDALPPMEALQRLMKESALVRFRRDWAQENLDLLARLVHQAPSYRLSAGRDLLDRSERSHELLGPLVR